MMAPHGASSVPRVRLSNSPMLAAGKRRTRGHTCGGPTRRPRSPCAATHTLAGPTMRAWPMPPRPPSPRGAGHSRRSAAWPGHPTASRSSCLPSGHRVGPSRAQTRANRRIARRRVRSGQVNGSVHDTTRLRKVGVHDPVMEICWALPNVRVRLPLGQPLISSNRNDL
jgi:hypothetical protein